MLTSRNQICGQLAEERSVRHRGYSCAGRCSGHLSGGIFQFDKEENSNKVLHRKIEGLICKASADELQRTYRVLKVAVGAVDAAELYLCQS